MTDLLQGELALPADIRDALSRSGERRGDLGRRLHWLPEADSTNDVAARCAADGAPEGTTIVAEAQTRGRGRQGRHWFSPPGAGLYMSVILRPPSQQPSARSTTPAGLLTMASGVAVAQAIRACTGLPVEIKWPNDVIIGGRKLAGILAESVSDSSGVQFVVLGIGVNLARASYPRELQDRVTSIEAETNRPADRALLLTEILAALNDRYAQLTRGSFDAILAAWRSCAPAIRSIVVEWEGQQGLARGRVEDIDIDGALLIWDGGVLRRVVSGEVRVVGNRSPGADAARD